MGEERVDPPSFPGPPSRMPPHTFHVNTPPILFSTVVNIHGGEQGNPREEVKNKLGRRDGPIRGMLWHLFPIITL